MGLDIFGAPWNCSLADPGGQLYLKTCAMSLVPVGVCDHPASGIVILSHLPPSPTVTSRGKMCPSRAAIPRNHGHGSKSARRVLGSQWGKGRLADPNFNHILYLRDKV